MRRSAEPFRPENPSVAELASGAVLVREPDGGILLLHYAAEDRWCFPKGHVEPGESLAQAATREIGEETGLRRFSLGAELGEVHYRFFDVRRSVNVFKTTVYFLATTRDPNVRPESIFDAHRWEPTESALDLVGYDTDRQMIERARALAGRGASTPRPRR